jgi:hypothetical protein
MKTPLVLWLCRRQLGITPAHGRVEAGLIPAESAAPAPTFQSQPPMRTCIAR